MPGVTGHGRSPTRRVVLICVGGFFGFSVGIPVTVILAVTLLGGGTTGPVNDAAVNAASGWGGVVGAAVGGLIVAWFTRGYRQRH